MKYVFVEIDLSEPTHNYDCSLFSLGSKEIQLSKLNLAICIVQK